MPLHLLLINNLLLLLPFLTFQVCVEARVLFRLELPSHKSIGVKAKQGKTVAEVLQPILLQYGWNVPEVEVYLDNEGRQEGERVDLGANVTAIDNKRLFVVQGKSHPEDREGGSETGQVSLLNVVKRVVALFSRRTL